MPFILGVLLVWLIFSAAAALFLGVILAGQTPIRYGDEDKQ